MFDFYVTLNIDESKINQLLQGQGIIMSAIQDLKDEVAQVKADAEAERVEVQAKLDQLKAQGAEHIELIRQLQEQIANGGGVTEAEIFEVLNSAKALRQAVKDISEPVPVVEPTPETPENTEPSA